MSLVQLPEPEITRLGRDCVRTILELAEQGRSSKLRRILVTARTALRAVDPSLVADSDLVGLASRARAGEYGDHATIHLHADLLRHADAGLDADVAGEAVAALLELVRRRRLIALRDVAASCRG